MTGIFCPACGRAAAQLAPGPGGRPAAACPYCGSLERHRILALLLRVIGSRLAGARVLDVAPSPHTTPLLQQLPLGQLIGMDFDPAADGRAVDVQASVTDLPFADDSLDFALCYHVFEHVPDDRRGMAELARVLRPTGLALVQVPWWPDQDTDEESGPTSAAERIRRFGQRDHVRYYGRETFDERLRGSGLEVVRFLVSDLLHAPLIAGLGLRADEAAWLVRPAGSAAPLAETLRSWVVELLGADGDRLPDLLPELVAVSTAEARLAREATGLRAELTGARDQAAELGAELAGLRVEVAGLHAGTRRQRAEIARLRRELARSRPNARAELARAGRAVESVLPGSVRGRLRGSGAVQAVRRRLR